MEKGDVGNTEIVCDVSSMDDIHNRLMTRMNMRKKTTRKTKESDGKKETHEVN